ncbi:Domain of unknown function DUF4314 [uncultured Caudovirales phage]|uniref:DUF4314 domain-containing protein n=1 Tax=uncultured Caudovirales phage TaxID=2100421 RepID=A0A6J5KRT2_9CAUD|nr:Domain of unknown function DUF4314 [uncultured Caudovirales phage]CAB4123753.1 Domain of unknown function DUF4314 [uncultured Caudovirales phage]CAB5219158.1 Domain of unknown function DUF4314 [uncultured Caudovirales phage]
MNEGTHVRLIEMKDEPQMPFGLKGTVMNIDDARQIHVKWENGTNLALIPGVDRFEVITQ